jgi:hypothetical protein
MLGIAPLDVCYGIAVLRAAARDAQNTPNSPNLAHTSVSVGAMLRAAAAAAAAAVRE